MGGGTPDIPALILRVPVMMVATIKKNTKYGFALFNRGRRNCSEARQRKTSVIIMAPWFMLNANFMLWTKADLKTLIPPLATHIPFNVSAAESILTRIQERVAPLPYRKFEADKIYGEIQEELEKLGELGVDELLMGTIDFQTRIILGMEEGDSNSAASCVLNEIAIWKEENCC